MTTLSQRLLLSLVLVAAVTCTEDSGDSSTPESSSVVAVGENPDLNFEEMEKTMHNVEFEGDCLEIDLGRVVPPQETDPRNPNPVSEPPELQEPMFRIHFRQSLTFVMTTTLFCYLVMVAAMVRLHSISTTRVTLWITSTLFVLSVVCAYSLLLVFNTAARAYPQVDPMRFMIWRLLRAFWHIFAFAGPAFLFLELFVPETPRIILKFLMVLVSIVVLIVSIIGC